MIKPFSINLSKFKKVGSDKHSTTLQHEDGHELKIAHSAVGAKLKKQLMSLELHPHMADGGKVEPSPTPKEKEPIVDPDQYKERMRGFPKLDKNPSMADGGEVEPSLYDSAKAKLLEAKERMQAAQDEYFKHQQQLFGIGEGKEHPLSDEERQKLAAEMGVNIAMGTIGGGPKSAAAINPAQKAAYKGASELYDVAQGEAAAKAAGQVPAKVMPQKGGFTPMQQLQMANRQAGAKRYADGGEIDNSQQLPPGVIDSGSAEEQNNQPAMQQIQESAPIDGAQPQQMQELGAGTPQGDLGPGNLQSKPQGLLAQQLDQLKAGVPVTDEPVSEGSSEKPSSLADTLSVDPSVGTKQQIQGMEAESQAKADLGQKEAELWQQSVKDLQNIQLKQQKAYEEMAKQQEKLTKEIQEGKINPDHYWQTHSKLGSIIGLLIAGFNPTNSPNRVAEMIQGEIKNDLEAQAKNLDSKHSVLRAALEKFGYDQRGFDAARITQTNLAAAKLNQLAAKATDPVVKARLLQNVGLLNASSAAQMKQFAVRQALMGGEGASQESGTQLRQGDPASFVPFVVPEKHQESVYKEIERAQNTRHMGKNIMDAFDAAAKDNTVMKTGAGLLRTPASVLALHQHMQPTFQDLEGTVRQAAMDNTFKNITPMPGDTSETVATKRQALEQYLQAKAAAPRAKSFNIDLDKFRSSTSSPLGRLDQNQMNIYNWAKSNPQDPRSVQALKRFKSMGIE